MIILAVAAEVFRADRDKDRHDKHNSRLFSFLLMCLKSVFLSVVCLWVSLDYKNKYGSVVNHCNGDNLFSMGEKAT
jgi:hypothetical protein